MNKWFYIFLSAISFLQPGCTQTPKAPASSQLPTIDYVTVGKMMDTIRAPYVIDLDKEGKKLVFIGCDHNRDSTHAQYDTIRWYFQKIAPAIALNEGGQMPDSLHFSSLADAAFRKGESGALKYLCDSATIPMLNGDTPDSTEFSITLKRYPKNELLLYYMMERLVIPYLNGAYGQQPFESLYTKAIDKWFVREGFPLNNQERTYDYFQALYAKYLGQPFELKLTKAVENFDFINGGDCHFCAVGRASKMVRDSLLLEKIKFHLHKSDRVIVTFGHAHAIALKPALIALFQAY